jgi:hypothetical protein
MAWNNCRRVRLILGETMRSRCVSLLVIAAAHGCADRPLPLPEPFANVPSGDLAGSWPDMGAPTDLAAPDLASPIDLASPPDLTAPPDLARPTLRQIAPLSSAVVGSRRPTLRWLLPAGFTAPTVELCADRACSVALGKATVDSSGTSARPGFDLATGPLFWRVRADDGTTRTSATWELFVGAGAGTRDNSSGSVPDFNGDGHADLTVARVPGEKGSGASYIYAGGASGISTSASAIIPGDVVNEMVSPWTAISAGDLNGDGYPELAVSEVFASAIGIGTLRLHIYYGGPLGVDTTRRDDLVDPVSASQSYTLIAHPGGDLDGDGYADLLVVTTELKHNASTLHLFRGGADGIASHPTASLQAPDNQQTFAQRLATCDIDGDGRLEILANSATGVLVFKWDGSSFVPAGSVDNSNTRLIGQLTLAAGDIDGDGYCDLLTDIYTGNTTPPQVGLFRGSANGLNTQPDQLFLGLERAWVVGDIDGDGIDDFVLGALGYPPRSVYAQLVFGGRWQTQNLPFVTTSTSGLVVAAGLGDVNGDGLGELALGNPDINSVSVFSGADLRQGNTNAPTTVSVTIDNSYFGLGLTGLY